MKKVYIKSFSQYVYDTSSNYIGQWQREQGDVAGVFRGGTQNLGTVL